MLAASFDRVGPPSVIELREFAEPVPGPDQILIQPSWSSVNPIDCYLRGGLVATPVNLPHIVGCDAAGRVIAVGSQVNDVCPGDRVWTTNQSLAGRPGVTAERIAVDRQWVYPSPPQVLDRDLAACGLVGVTAHLGLFHHGQLCEGETVLVKGGGGAIGSMVIQMAKAAGARVIATTSSAEKSEYCRQRGADEVFDYRQPHWSEQVAKVSAGVDLCWETSREPDLAESIGLMREQGRIVIMAGREAQANLPIGPFYVKQLKLLGLIVFKNPAEAVRLAALDINRWLQQGLIRPAIAHEFPWTDAVRAHECQENATLNRDGKLSGKIMLQLA